MANPADKIYGELLSTALNTANLGIASRFTRDPYEEHESLPDDVAIRISGIGETRTRLSRITWQKDTHLVVHFIRPCEPTDSTLIETLLAQFDSVLDLIQTVSLNEKKCSQIEYQDRFDQETLQTSQRLQCFAIVTYKGA